ncbi:MAG: ShlB/FhaC/HecB family hemolysin secretion/activation protein [Duganella sp.]
MTISSRRLRAHPAARLRWSAYAVALLCHTGSALAQLMPAQVDPGALQRQEEERRRYLNEQGQLKERPATVLDVPAPAAPAAPASGVRFMLSAVDFGPSKLLTEAELAAIAARYIGREVDFTALSTLVEEINAQYRSHGIVTARAVIGAQKIEHGVVKVDLVEARLERIDVQGNGYTTADYVTAAFADQQGQTLDTHVLEKRILRFNRGGDLRIEASLRPGASVGATDLVLNLTEPPRYQTRLFVNNEGARSVGAVQAGVDAAVNGLFGINDRLSLYVARTRGATSGMLAYAVPVNQYGGRVTASYSQGVTEVVAGPYRSLDISGKSKTLQAGLVQPVWHAGAWWFDLAGTVARTRSDNEIGGLALSHTDVDNAALGATAAGTWDQRSINLAFTATHAREQALAKPERSFNIRQLRASWVESVGGRSYSVVRTVLQDTDATILTPALLFQLGGVGTVRGYEVGALSGDRGYLVNAEFHHAPSAGIDASVFADVGAVRTTGVPNQVAKSVGAAIDVQLGNAWRGNLTTARTLRQVLPDQARWRVTARASYEF